MFKFIKRQLLKVIEWKDDSRDTIAYRYDVPDRYAIMKNSQLIVRESQMAIFVVEGKIADVFAPGRYTLDDIKNIPILTSILNWKYAFETPYTGDVYFINTKQFTEQKWGTSNPVMMRDKEFGMIRLRGYGIFAYRVNDPAKLLRELLGTRYILKTTDVIEQFKKSMVSRLSDAIAESKLPALDLAMHYDELSELAQTRIAPDFEQFGLILTSLYIENLSLPEEVEKSLDTRSTLGILGDKMGQFTQYQAAQAIRDAAQNEGGGLAGAGVGLGAGVGMGGMFMNALNQSMSGNGNASANDKPQEGAIRCPKCDKENNASAKFCHSCGEKLLSECSNCKHPLPKGAKFCLDCGTPVGVKECPKCKSAIPNGAKFCPSCGEKA